MIEWRQHGSKDLWVAHNTAHPYRAYVRETMGIRRWHWAVYNDFHHSAMKPWREGDEFTIEHAQAMAVAIMALDGV